MPDKPERGAPSFDIPDLDVPVAPNAPSRAPSAASRAPGAASRAPGAASRAPGASVPAARSPSAKPARSQNPQDYFGSGTFEDDHFDAGAGSGIDLAGERGTGLDVDLSAAPGAAAREASVAPQAYFGSGTFENDDFDDAFEHGNALAMEAPGEASSGGAAGLASDERWPSGRSPERGLARIDEVEVKLSADYGKPPENALFSPLYALRVYTRQRALRPALASAENELRAGERRRDELLGEMVSALRPQLEADARLNELLNPVREIDRVAGERGQALATVNAEYQTLAGGIEARASAVREQVIERQSVERERLGELEAHEQAFRRAGARVKRIQIELRSVMQVAAQAAQAAALPQGTVQPEHAQRIQALQAQIAAHQPEVDALRQSFDAARAAVEAIRVEINQITRGLRQIESERRALDLKFGKQLDERSQGVSQAEEQLREALAEAGRGVLALRGGVPVEPTTLEAIRAADASVERQTVDAEKLVRALDSFDRAAVKRGYVVAGAMLAAVVVLILLLILL